MRKRIYSLAMILSLFLGVLPLLLYFSAFILAAINGCGQVFLTTFESCTLGYKIETLFILTQFFKVSVPVGIGFFLMFLYLYNN